MQATRSANQAMQSSMNSCTRLQSAAGNSVTLHGRLLVSLVDSERRPFVVWKAMHLWGWDNLSTSVANEPESHERRVFSSYLMCEFTGVKETTSPL